MLDSAQRFFSFLSFERREMQRGIQLEKSGCKEEALEIFTELVGRDPGCKACRFHMGRLANELSKMDLNNAYEKNSGVPELKAKI